MTVSWKKVHWQDFNLSVEQLLEDVRKIKDCPENKMKQVHYLAKKVQNAYSEASKDLPKGCRPDPVIWCMDELEALLEERSIA
eukprot:9942725-Ditylum_brightwellii.AAC.1